MTETEYMALARLCREYLWDKLEALPDDPIEAMAEYKTGTWKRLEYGIRHPSEFPDGIIDPPLGDNLPSAIAQRELERFVRLES